MADDQKWSDVPTETKWGDVDKGQTWDDLRKQDVAQADTE